MEKIIFNNENFPKEAFLRFLSGKTGTRHFKQILSKIIAYTIDIAMVTGPSMAYVFQILKFHKTKSSQGFSKFVCLLLFLGNILRIYFWLGKHFKITLLYQSIGIVVSQVALIHFYMKYQDNKKSYLPEIKRTNNNSLLKLEKRNNINLIKNYIAAYFSKTFKPRFFSLSKIFNAKLFWNWQEELEYYKFMILVIIILSILFVFFHKVNIFLQIIGSFSAGFESLVSFPQVYQNFKIKVTKNISFMMTLFWFLGDSFRLFYNINYKAPLQLIIGIGIVTFFDLVLVFQLILYRNNSFKELEKTANKKQIEEINQLMKSIDEVSLAK